MRLNTASSRPARPGCPGSLRKRLKSPSKSTFISNSYFFNPSDALAQDPSFPPPLSARSSKAPLGFRGAERRPSRSEEHTSELQSLLRISYAVFCLKKKNTPHITTHNRHTTQQQTSQSH